MRARRQTIATVLGMSLAVGLAASQSLAGVHRGLECIDWTARASAIQTVPDDPQRICQAEPETRFLEAHALLATGQYNRAAPRFLCATDSPGSPSVERWSVWVEWFVEQHPSCASAHYLRGDALARSGRLLEAVTAFDRAVELDPRDPMARSARGVARWIYSFEGDISEEESYQLVLLSVTDWLDAGENARFGDAWVNRGLVDLYRSNEPDAAMESFEKALEIDQSFAMALNGRACAYGARGKQGDLELARKDLEHAESELPQVPLIVENMAAIQGLGGHQSVLRELAAEQDQEHRGVTISAGLSGIVPQFEITAELGQFFESMRGGLYVTLKEGKNFVIDREKNPQVVGTWFLLNYPLSQDALRRKETTR